MRATMSKIVCGGLGALAVLAVLCATDLAHADGTMSVPCPPSGLTAAAFVEVAQSSRSGAILSRTPRSVQLAPGTTTTTATVGGKAIMTIADPAGGVPATIECFCIAQLGSGGYCFPMQIGNSVTCQGSPGSGCACMMGLIIPDAPG